MSKRWTPENNEGYWCVLDTTPMQTAWCGSQYDIARWEAGNVFKTHDKALIASINIKSLLLSLHYNETSTANSETLKGTFTEHLKKFAEPQNTPEETKLPDWCKVGEWVYNKDFHEYIKVIERTHNTIKGEDIHGGVYYADFQFKNTVPARPRPWTAREAIGKIVCWEGDYSFQENMAIINAVDCDGNLMGDLLGNTNLNDLTKKCFYQLDGQPCGVLEHLENGEWVK